MFLKYSNSLFMLILFFTPFMVVSSSSWLLMWMSLEINLMMFIPLLMNKINFNSTNSSIKYFIIQAMASIILVFSFILFSNKNSFYSININNEMISLSMLMKSGIPPFQFWLPQVMENMMYNQIFVLLTWQKIAPMFMLNFFVSNLIIIVLFISSLIGSIGGLNQNSLKKILAYSSMSHSAWIIMTLFTNMKIWLIYFISYGLMILSMVIILNNFKIKKISCLSNSYTPKDIKILFLLNLLSLGGLPPFIGFLSKFLVLNYVFFMEMKTVLIFMIIMSLISLFYYLKVSYIFMFLKQVSFKALNLNTIFNPQLIVLVMILSNLFIPMIILLM